MLTSTLGAAPAPDNPADRFARDFLPIVRRVANVAFGAMNPEARAEATAETVAHAFGMFDLLARDGREALAYPTVLASYGVRRVRSGRLFASADRPGECKCKLQGRGRAIGHLGKVADLLVDDRRATPADLAAARIDIATWLAMLPKRNRRVAKYLAIGARTGEAAQRFRLSAARVSQLRAALRFSWARFQGEV